MNTPPSPEQKKMRELKDWILKKMAGADDFIHTSVFDKNQTLYSTPLSNNFIATIINGSSMPAGFNVKLGEFQYNHLIKQVAAVTKKDPAVWFYYTVIDNSIGELKPQDLWECNYTFSLDYPLERFERWPAKEGGVSFLGLLSKNKSWLLLHTYTPRESFEISFHGSESLAKNLASALNANL